MKPPWPDVESGHRFFQQAIDRESAMRGDDTDIDTLLKTKEGVQQVVETFDRQLISEAQLLMRTEKKKSGSPHLTVDQAIAILAPRGHQEACLTMAVRLGWAPQPDKSAAENLFKALHGIALIWAAYEAHPGYITITEENCGKVAECATLIDPTTLRHKATHGKLLTWFRENHADEAAIIGEQLKAEMRKQGWRI
jgi:hypothetical protein